MMALKLASIAMMGTVLAVLLAMLAESLLCGQRGIWQRLQAAYLRLWCAIPSTWLPALLARLGRV